MLHSFRGNSVGADCGVRRHLPMRASRSMASQIRSATSEPNLSSATAGDNPAGIRVPWARPAPRTACPERSEGLHTRGACPSLIGTSIARPCPPSHRTAARDQRRDDNNTLIKMSRRRPPLGPRGDKFWPSASNLRWFLLR